MSADKAAFKKLPPGRQLPPAKPKAPTRQPPSACCVGAAGMAGAATGGAAGVAAGAGAAERGRCEGYDEEAGDDEEGDEDEDEGEEEDETEEAQVCWSMAFAFLPLICEIMAEFATALIDAGVFQYLALLLIPIWTFIKSLFGIITRPPAPPAMAPPAPPPPPISPDLMTAVSTATFSFAAAHPSAYLLIDFSAAVAVGTFFLFLQDLQNWMEAREQAARQAHAHAEAGGVACDSQACSPADGDEEEEGGGGGGGGGGGISALAGRWGKVRAAAKIGDLEQAEVQPLVEILAGQRQACLLASSLTHLLTYLLRCSRWSRYLQASSRPSHTASCRRSCASLTTRSRSSRSRLGSCASRARSLRSLSVRL